MSTKVGDIFVRANLDDKQYQKGLNGLDKTTSKIGKKLATALSVTAIISGITSTINKVSSLGDAVDKTSQKLGMSNKTYQEWDYIMQRSGASIDSMTVAMKTLATSVQTGKDALAELGITQEEALGLSQEELFNRVVTALQGVEDTTRRTYLAGQLLGRGATELGAVLNLSQQDMANMRNRVAELGGVMSDVAVKNSAQFRDSLLDVKMAFRGIGNTIAEYVLPILTNAIQNYIIPAIQWLGRVVSKILSAFGSVGERIKQTFNKNTQKGIENTSAGLENVGSNLGKTSKNAKGARKEVQKLKRELAGFDKITKLADEQGVSSGGNTGTSSGGSISAPGVDFTQADSDVDSFTQRAREKLAQIQLPQPLQKALKDLKDSFSDLFDVLGDAGKWAYDNVLKPLGEWTLNEYAPVAVEGLANVIKTLANALKFIGEVLEPIWNPFLKPLFSALGDFILFPMEVASKAWEVFGTVLGDAVEGLKNLKIWGEDGIGTVKEKWGELKENATEVALNVKDNITDKLDTIKTKWDTFRGNVHGKVAEATANLKGNASDKITKAKKAWDGLKSAINKKKKNIKLAFSMTGQKILEKAKKLWDGISQKRKDLKLTFTDAFTSAMKKAWNGVATGINKGIDIINKIPGVNIGKIKMLAQGGYVKKNTPQLAMIGDNKREGEIVAPESKLQAMANQASQGGNAEVVRLLNALLTAVQTKDTAVYLDGEQIKNNVVRRINNHTRATGQLEIIV